MRNISFMLTTQQFRDRSKTVTRRLGWQTLQRGTLLMGCEKCQGLKPGEPLVRLGQIRVKDVSIEQLDLMMIEPYGTREATLEGFPTLNGAGFVAMFCKHMKCVESTVVTRIEFEYV